MTSIPKIPPGVATGELLRGDKVPRESFPGAKEASHRDRAVQRAFGASLIGKILSIACTLAQVPLIIRLLGTNGYGVWVTLIGLSVLLNALDFGLGLGMQQRMAEAFARNDTESVRRNFFTGAMFLGIIGGGVLILGTLLIYAVDWATVLHVTDPILRRALRPALLLTVSVTALGMPLNALPRLAVAVQRGWLQGVWIALGSIVTLLAVALAALAQRGLFTLVALTTLLPVLQGLGLGVHAFRTLKWSGKIPPLLSPAERTQLRSASFLYIPTQFSLAFFAAVPAIALSWISGMVLVAQYNLLQRLYSPLVQGQMMVLTPLLPVYTEAHQRGDRAWTRRTLKKMLWITGLLVAGVGLVTWQSPFLVTHWTAAADTVPDPAIRWLAALWISSQLFVLVPTYFLLGVGELRRVAQAATMGLSLSVLGWFLAGHLFGPEFALLAGTGGLLAGSGPGLWRAMQAQGGRRQPGR